MFRAPESTRLCGQTASCATIHCPRSTAHRPEIRNAVTAVRIPVDGHENGLCVEALVAAVNHGLSEDALQSVKFWAELYDKSPQGSHVHPVDAFVDSGNESDDCEMLDSVTQIRGTTDPSRPPSTMDRPMYASSDCTIPINSLRRVETVPTGMPARLVYTHKAMPRAADTTDLVRQINAVVGGLVDKTVIPFWVAFVQKRPDENGPPCDVSVTNRCTTHRKGECIEAVDRGIGSCPAGVLHVVCRSSDQPWTCHCADARV